MSLKSFDMTGRVALVTGASSRGIGSGAAKIMAEAGAKVFLVARREDKLQERVAEIGAMGAEAGYAALDMSSEEACKQAVEACIERFGQLDVMVLAAGISGLSERSLDAMFDVENYKRLQALNQDQIFYMTKYGYPELAKGGHGSIVYLSSLAPFSSNGSVAYAAAKGAIRSWTTHFAKKLAPMNIRVNAIAPGLTDTDMVHPEGSEEMFQKYVAPSAAKIPLGRLGTIDDMANAILYFASDASCWTTGQTLIVDGGQLS